MLIWADGFEHYGTDSSKMLNGGYATNNWAAIATNNPRTGSRNLQINGNNGAQVRHPFKTGTLSKVGFGFSMYLNQLLGAQWDCLDIGGNAQLNFKVLQTGVIQVTQGNYPNAVLGQTTTPVISANAHYHIECYVEINNGAGVVKINVNQANVLTLTGKNTSPQLANDCSQLAFYVSYPSVWDLDDFYIYDTTGTINNAFPVGDMRCILVPPMGDTAQADLAKSSGTVGFSLINETTPDDTTYIQATAVGQKSDFDLTDIPTDITFLAGLFLHTRAQKSDAGPAQLKGSIVSGASVGALTDRPVTTTPTYWFDALELDPATGARWTRTGFNAAKVRYERTV